jgi:hypothetical protein
MTKSMFGMAIAIIVMSLIVLLLPTFFAHTDEPTRKELIWQE